MPSQNLQFQGDSRFQILSLLSSQHIQHNTVGNQLRIFRVFFKCSSQGSFGLGYTTQVQLCDGLADDRKRRGRARRGGEFFVNVKCGLVLLATLFQNNVSPTWEHHGKWTAPYHSHANPGLGQVDQQRVLRPALGSLDLLECEVGAVLLEVNLDDQGDTANARSVKIGLLVSRL